MELGEGLLEVVHELLLLGRHVVAPVAQEDRPEEQEKAGHQERAAGYER